MILAKIFVSIAILSTSTAQNAYRGPTGKDYLLLDETLNYTAAEERCHQLDRVLPTVKTQQEIGFLASLPLQTGFLLLGAKPEIVSGRCAAKWLSDGSLVTNARWAAREPICDGKCRTVEYHVFAKTWHTSPCDSYSYAVFCEAVVPEEDQVKIAQMREEQQKLIEEMKLLKEDQKGLKQKVEFLTNRADKDETAEIMSKFLEELDEVRRTVSANEAKNVKAVESCINTVETLSAGQVEHGKRIDYLYG